MPYEPRPGEVCLFENEKMGNERAPDHRGYIIAHRDIKAGEKVSLSLWRGKPDGSRSFGGMLSDPARPSEPAPEVDLFGNAVRAE